MTPKATKGRANPAAQRNASARKARAGRTSRAASTAKAPKAPRASVAKGPAKTLGKAAATVPANGPRKGPGKTPSNASAKASPKGQAQAAGLRRRPSDPRGFGTATAPDPTGHGLAYLDGTVLPLAQARVPLNDRGFLLGDGVFETMRVSNGRPFRLQEHADRLARGLKAINLDPSLVSEFQDAVAALTKSGVQAFGGDLYVRVMMTTGPMEDVLDTGRGFAVQGLCKKFKPYPMQYYSNGIEVIVSRQRKDSRSPLSAVKTLSFLPYIAARREAHSATAHDALLLNEAGRVAEGSTSNVFCLHKGVVYAPGESEGAIPGVTRAAVLELLEDTGLQVEERLELATMRQADEAWLTNTTGGIVPITRFMDKAVGTGKRGELTAQLSHALEAQIRG